jgi:nickel/cobalt transporter (NicO) family protein
MEWLSKIQAVIHRVIAADLSSFAATHDWTALLAVLPLGIAFGAVHAFTPGHGKSVLASYVVGSRLAALKATGVAAILAVTHVGMGVLLALLAAPLITRALPHAGRAPVLEKASGALLVGVGAWVVTRALRARHLHAYAHAHAGPLVGIFAGLVPCPLTLFVMMFALARGVPEAGATFAVAMMLGVMTTLAIVALVAVLARDTLVGFLAQRGASVARVSRILDGASGVLLAAFGLAQMIR